MKIFHWVKKKIREPVWVPVGWHQDTRSVSLLGIQPHSPMPKCMQLTSAYLRNYGGKERTYCNIL